MDAQSNLFYDRLESFIEDRTLIKLIISKKRYKSSELKSITVTIVKLKAGFRLSFLYRYNTKDITKNYNFTQGLDYIKQALDAEFFNADLFSEKEIISFKSNKKGTVNVKISEADLQPATIFAHDKYKNKPIKTQGNIYLKELGITNAKEELRREMSDKFKQINRYIELLEPQFNEISLTADSHIADMGSGKGYLTFALYDYLKNKQNIEAKMTGVEYRKDLVNTCNQIAKKANFKQLNFIQGTIENTDIEQITVLIALHACDTATDEALYRGIKSGASLIVVAPCCHKQIRKAFNVNNELASVMKFGILKERQAELITDGLRALILESYGYKTKVFEFISGEHTPKNVMITAVKHHISDKKKSKILNDIKSIKQTFGINEHYLEKLLEL